MDIDRLLEATLADAHYRAIMAELDRESQEQACADAAKPPEEAE